jgi:hypothetical protein
MHLLRLVNSVPFPAMMLTACVCLTWLLMPLAAPAGEGTSVETPASKLTSSVSASTRAKLAVELEDRVGAEAILKVPAVTPVALIAFPGEALSGVPADLGPDALYGTLRHGGADGIVSIIIDPQPDGTERVFIDLNDDEDLSNDAVVTWVGDYAIGGLGEALLPTATVEVMMSCQDGMELPIVLKLRRFEKAKVKGRTGITVRNGLLISVDTYREGVLEIGEERMAIAVLPTVLSGRHTLFTHPSNALVIDLNRDGVLDGTPMRSPERFRLGTPFTHAERTYKVSVAACHGRSITAGPATGV